jgi:hypothetical protein
MRGPAKFKQGDTAGSEKDIPAAKTIQPNIGDDLTPFGVR